MVESRDELIMEFANKYGYNRSDEDVDDEDDDDDDGGDAATTPTATPPPASAPPAAAPKVVTVDEEDPMEMILEQEAYEAHDVILAELEPNLS
jgi:hypothetical protein